MEKTLSPDQFVMVTILVKLGGPGLGVEPGTQSWWLARLPWTLLLGALLFPVMAALGRFERPGPANTEPPPAWRDGGVIAGLSRFDPRSDPRACVP